MEDPKGKRPTSAVSHVFHIFQNTIGFNFYLLESLTELDRRAASLLRTSELYSAKIGFSYFNKYFQIPFLSESMFGWAFHPFLPSTKGQQCCPFVHEPLLLLHGSESKSKLHTLQPLTPTY